MVDQSHNLKLLRHQASCSLIDAEECLKAAFSTVVRPAIEEWRRARGLAANPLRAFRESGYLKRAVEERARHAQPVASYA